MRVIPCPLFARQPLFLMSDIHLGSREMDFLLFKRHLQRVVDEDGLLLINGDLFDAIFPTDKRFDMGFHGDLSHADMIGEVVLGAVEVFKPVAGRLVMCGMGNHEHTVLTRYHVDMIRLFCVGLRSHGGIVQHGGYSGFVRVKVLDPPAKKRGASCYIFYHHGWGGNSKSGNRTLLQDLRSKVLADVYWVGHKHQTSIFSEERIIPHRLHAHKRAEWLVSTGSYLTQSVLHAEESHVPYAVKSGHLVGSARAMIRIEFDAEGDIARVEAV